MRKDEYIASAVSKISNKKAKRETEAELAEHIDELIDFYLGRGYTETEAEEKSVADMGGPELVAEKLSQLHPSPISTFLLVLTAIGTIKTLLAILFFFTMYTGEIMNVLATVFIVFEIATDALTLFCVQPIIVLILSIIDYTARKKDDCPSPYNGPLAIICVIVWIIAAYASYQTCLLGF